MILPPLQTKPSAWYGPDMATKENQWLCYFTSAEIAELEAAAESLIVEVLPAKDPNAAVLTYPLKVRLNPDSPPVSRLGSRTKPRGEVILKTGHPAAKQLRFQVQFSVN